MTYRNFKNIGVLMLLFAAFFGANRTVNAAVTIHSSNLTKATGGTEIASGSRRLTAGFGTGSTVSYLTSVSLLMASSGGQAAVSVYSNKNLSPGSLVGTLTAPASYGSTLAATTFTANGTITLAANSSYWVVLQADSGSFSWAWSTDNTGDGTGYQHTWGESDDAGATWHTYNVFPLQMTVTASTDATATPTPTVTPTVTPTATPTASYNTVTGCLSTYTALGGVISSDPTTSVLGSKLFVFARGTDGGIYYQTSTGGSFSGWNSLGGGTNSAPMSIVVGSTLYVEVTGTDNNRYYRSTTDGSTFSNWTQGTVGASTNATAILGTTSYNFLRGSTGTQPNLCALATAGATPTPTPTLTPTPTPAATPTLTPTATPATGYNTVTGCLTNYTALGGIISSNPTTNIVNSRIVVFAKGTDGAIYFQYSSGGNFSGWNALGGGTNADPMSIVVGSTLYLEVVGTDNNRYYKATTDGVSFSNWTSGTMGASTNATSILGTTSYNFVRGSAGTQPNLCMLATSGVNPTPTPTVTPTATPTVTPTATPTPNTTTGCASGYSSLGGVINSDPSAVVFNNRILVFARGTDGAIYYQYSTGGAFSGWNSLGGVSLSNPRTSVSGSTMYVEVTGSDNNTYRRTTTDGVNFAGWAAAAVSPAATTPSVSFNNLTYIFAKGSGSSPNLCVATQ